MFSQTAFIAVVAVPTLALGLVGLIAWFFGRRAERARDVATCYSLRLAALRELDEEAETHRKRQRSIASFQVYASWKLHDVLQANGIELIEHGCYVRGFRLLNATSCGV